MTIALFPTIKVVPSFSLLKYIFKNPLFESAVQVCAWKQLRGESEVLGSRVTSTGVTVCACGHVFYILPDILIAHKTTRRVIGCVEEFQTSWTMMRKQMSIRSV